MNTSSPKSAIVQSKRRFGVVLACLLLMVFVLPDGSAQLKGAKRITALQLGDAAEGARVTVVSDSALNDYEAFRRGDHFYVKIPFAAFAATRPRFKSDEFEDIQVQQIGDSVVVSFKLQPGATAHVDQRSNRLDVMFLAPIRTGRSAPTTGRLPRGSYSAGPLPPGSPLGSRDRLVRPDTAESSNPSALRMNSRFNSTGDANNSASTVNTAQPSPSINPQTSPSSAGYPGSIGTSTYVATPQSAGTQSSSSIKWEDRARRWLSVNRRTSVIGGLGLLAALIFLALVLRDRRQAVKSKRAKGALAQPKFSPERGLGAVKSGDPLAAKPPHTVHENRATIAETETGRPVKTSGSRSAVSTEQSLRETAVRQPAVTSSVASSDYGRVLSRPTSSLTREIGRVTSEEEEREVFGI